MKFIVKLHEATGTVALREGPLRYERNEHTITVATWDNPADALAHVDTLNARGVKGTRAWMDIEGLDKSTAGVLSCFQRLRQTTTWQLHSRFRSRR